MIILFAKAVLGFIFLSKGAGALGLGGVRLEGLGLETSSKLGVGLAWKNISSKAKLFARKIQWGVIYKARLEKNVPLVEKGNDCKDNFGTTACPISETPL
jgi:hypothetical protein